MTSIGQKYSSENLISVKVNFYFYGTFLNQGYRVPKGEQNKQTKDKKNIYLNKHLIFKSKTNKNC